MLAGGTMSTSSSTGVEREIGSVSTLSLMRAIEAILLCVCVGAILVIASSNWMVAVFCALFAIIFGCMAHRSIALRAGVNGVTVQRYFKEQLVPWRDIVSIEFRYLGASSLSIRFAEPVQGSKVGDVIGATWTRDDVRDIWKRARKRRPPENGEWLLAMFNESNSKSS
jgi:hypothetical protein